MLLLLTLVAAYTQRSKQDQPPAPRETRSVQSAPVETGRCAISHARFGDRSAQLVKVMRGAVPNFVVVEIGKRDPLLRLQRGRWLHAAYGGGEQAWLGEFGSAQTAMARAAALCPPSLRCWPGEPGCGPQEPPLTPAQAFLRSHGISADVAGANGADRITKRDGHLPFIIQSVSESDPSSLLDPSGSRPLCLTPPC